MPWPSNAVISFFTVCSSATGRSFFFPLDLYAVMQYRYHTGKITHEKYFEWKLQWSFGSTITHSSPLPKDIDALLQNSNED
jgi:hypothetical protein